MSKSYYDLEIGQIRKNKDGEQFEIVGIKGCKSVRVRFLKKNYYKTTTAFYANNGIVRLPKYIVGDEFIDKRGDVCRITNKVSHTYTLMWEDGYSRNVSASAFVSGIMREEDSSKHNPKIKVGFKGTNLQGFEFEVIEKLGDSKFVVRFSMPVEYKVVAYRGNIEKGTVHYPHTPTVAGVGIIGEFPVDVTSKDYRAWAGMLKRCYNPGRVETGITYQGVTVCDDWKLYENFHKWSCSAVYQEGWHLDKDLLEKGNKVYCPDKCVFLPPELNWFLTDRRNHRGMYPKGVTYRPSVGNYQATCNYKGSPEYLGVFDTPELAFIAYKQRKEAIAKELAWEYRGVIDVKAVEALLSYTVDISD